MKQIIGIVLISIPFVLVGGLAISQIGIAKTLLAVLITVVFVGLILLGTWCIVGH